jgi:Cu/Ag efflux pump CusA
MISRLLDFALTHRWFVLALGVFLFVMGIIQFHRLNIEAYPDTANNYA